MLTLLLMMILLAFFRYGLADPNIYSNHILNESGKEVVLIGHIAEEPDVRIDSVRYIVEVKSANKNDVRGRVYFKSLLYPRYNYGQNIEIKCKLEKPKNFFDNDFHFDKYLAKMNVYTVCLEPKINKMNSNSGNIFYLFLIKTKNKIAEKITMLWHEPYASFMAGLLYGYRGGLGKLSELFSRTGVTHIVAISGYNITLICNILVIFCINLYIPRKKAFWVIMSGLIIFVLFTGAGASVVRAGIMGTIVLIRKQLGRMARMDNILILTASLMALINPYIIIWDPGFQLSFLATIGLIYLSPKLRPWFEKVPELLGVKEIFISTISAIISTLPLILFQFGRLSIVAPLTNILVLWIIPLIMLMGFVSVVAGFFFQPLALFFSWIALIGLGYVVFVVRFIAKLSFAAVEFNLPWWLMLVMYFILGYYIFYKKRHGSVAESA